MGDHRSVGHGTGGDFMPLTADVGTRILKELDGTLVRKEVLSGVLVQKTQLTGVLRIG